MAEAKRLLILTRDTANAAFRQRIAPYLAALEARGIATETVVLAKATLARRRQLARAADFDGVLLHRKTLTFWDAGPLVKHARRLIYDFDDAVMFQARAPFKPHPGRLYRFRRTVRAADLVLAGSPVLEEHATKAGARRVEVVPTGLDASRFPVRDHAAAAGPVRLVWIGSRSTLKQLEPLRKALEAVGRALPGARLRVIADAPLTLDGLEVENVAWSLEGEGRLLAESDVGIAPLPDTPFTRGKCGFKVLQYMAAGLPVVASPVGVNADYVEPGRTGYQAVTTDEWVDAVSRLASDAALRARLGREGRRRVVERYDFGVLAARVCDLVREVLA